MRRQIGLFPAVHMTVADLTWFKNLERIAIARLLIVGHGFKKGDLISEE